jgi:predicted membrane protein
MKHQTTKKRMSLGALVAAFILTGVVPAIGITPAKADPDKKIVVVVGPVTKTPKPTPSPKP